MAAKFFFIIFLVHLIFIININAGNATTLPKFPAILIFGDSTVDTGNNNFILTTFKGNHIPYGQDFPNRIATGRFSNGKLISDLLASELGIKEFVPPFLDPFLSDSELSTGVCFASAGSGFDDLTSFTQVVPVSAQSGYFKTYLKKLKGVVGEEEAKKIVNDAFVIISAGTNDLVLNFYDIPVRRSQYSLSQYQDFLLQRLHVLVKELYDDGCRNFLIPGLAPIGCAPIQLTVKLQTKCMESENLGAQLYNSKLQKLVQELQSSLPGSKVVYSDMYNLVLDMITNPKIYGFQVTSVGCCGSGIVEVGPFCNAWTIPCANPSQYLFWDAVHPGEAAYRIITKYLVDNIMPKFL